MRDFGPQGDRLQPIQIRPRLTVYVQDIPHDLTPAEAEKIAAVIRAMASPAPRALDDKG